jgi:hypothetical protein
MSDMYARLMAARGTASTLVYHSQEILTCVIAT